MSLSDRLESMQPKETGLPCGVGRVLKDMDDKSKQTLEVFMFAEPRTLSNTQLQQALIEEGYDVSYSSISLHRRKHCRCFIGRTTRMVATK